ncbi:MAG: 50S ribosomal protein L32 [SAR202 cluster bacterium]|nr:50S ribosomal protein L32 [SAR202 cluster bacterium]
MPPHPKKKHSHSTHGGRNAHKAMTPAMYGQCPQCRQAKLPHRVCRHCGYYNGREVVPVETNEAE